MNITFVLKTIGRTIGGGPLVIFKYANYLAENGHDVELLILDSEMWSRAHLPEAIRRFLVEKSVQKRPSWFELNKNIKKYCVFDNDLSMVHDADVVIATAVDTAQSVAAMHDSKGKKLYFIQGYENWVLPDEEVRETYNLGLVNITVSNWLSGIVDRYSENKSICVTNGIDTNIFKPTAELDKRKKHSIVFQYRSSKAKGCEYAIEVCKKIKNKYSDAEINVISNEEKPENLPDYFHYNQNVSQEEVAKINNESSVFVCTTIDEGFGLPGLEAMACGCAVVSSSYQGVLEYAADGENALLSHVRDVDAMVANIVKLFEEDELRKRIAENGIKTGEERSLENSAKEFERILVEECGK